MPDNELFEMVLLLLDVFFFFFFFTDCFLNFLNVVMLHLCYVSKLSD